MVRHGATELSAEDRFAGVTNVELSDEGREQARRLSERLSAEKIAAVYASPLGRTVETARILAAPHDLPVQTCDGFREISHGHWEGMKRREVEEKFPEEMAEWEKDPYTFAPAGWGERAGRNSPRFASVDRFGARASRRKHSDCVSQGDNPTLAEFVARIRSAAIPR